MEDFAVLIQTVLWLLQLEFPIWGFTFSFWQIMLFGLVVFIIIWFLGGFFDND